jgi:hypothetical protein
MNVSLSLPCGLALVAASICLPLAVHAQDPARGLTVVPAPVGPDGAVQELYAGSYALLVGVSRYDTPAAWAPLETVPNELEALAKTLRQVGFEHVEQVLNPTHDELQQAVQKFMRSYGYRSDTRLLFFFAGHGYSLDNGTRGYFVPRNAPDPLKDEGGFRATALSMQQVNTWAGELTARHVLFAFDSCFSGTIFRTRNRIQPSRITAATQKPVRQFLSAGGAGETVPAKSVFLPVFARGMTGTADLDKDGYVTGTELFNYVQGEVIAYATGQTPQFGTIRDPRYDEGDIVFAVPGTATAATLATRPPPAKPPAPAAPQPPPASQSAQTAVSTPPNPAPRVTPSNPAPAGRAIAGCWVYNTINLSVYDDGRITGFLDGGQWSLIADNRYLITWPPSIDTLVLSGDGNTLSGSNNYAGPVPSASRISGNARSVVGAWKWANGSTTVFSEGGEVQNGPVSGKWTQLRGNTIRIVWNFFFTDEVTLSSDGQNLTGKNMLGQPVSGRRVACSK